MFWFPLAFLSFLTLYQALLVSCFIVPSVILYSLWRNVKDNKWGGSIMEIKNLGCALKKKEILGLHQNG